MNRFSLILNLASISKNTLNKTDGAHNKSIAPSVSILYLLFLQSKSIQISG